MSVNIAGLSDLEAFCHLVEAKTYPDNPVTGLSGASRQRMLLKKYREDWEQTVSSPKVSILLGEHGFVVALLQEKDSLTGHRQTVIWDWGGEPSAWLGTLEDQACNQGSEYLVLRVHPGPVNAFQNLGFLPELTRVSKKVEPQSYAGPFGLRRATAADLLFIASLNSQGMAFYLPANRGLDPVEMASRNTTHYLGLDLGEGSDMLGLLISEGRRPFGYILLKLGLRVEYTDESAAYLYDLNLRPEYWGKGAGRILGNYTQTELRNRDCEYLLGDISCANPRTLQVATAAIGFQPEWERWGKKLDSGRTYQDESD